MRNDSRQFFVYDLEICARKAEAKIPSFEEVYEVWKKSKENNVVHPIKSSSAFLKIGDIDFDRFNKTATLLVRISDTAYPNSVYSDHVSNLFTEHQKSGTTGADFGCHVIISTVSEKNKPNTYTSLVEKMTNLPGSIVQRLLSKLLNIEYSNNNQFYVYPHPAGGLTREGEPRLERCCPHIELGGRPSEAFISDINRGRLSGVRLIRSEPRTPMGSGGFLVKEQSDLILSVDQGSVPQQLYDHIRSFASSNSAAYQRTCVSYRLPDSKRTVTVELDSKTGAPIEDLYVQSIDITRINPLLSQSSEAIVRHLEAKAKPHLIHYRDI